MGYHITLSRPEPKPKITEDEWRCFVESRQELTLEPAEKGAHFITAILDGQDDLALHYCQGDVFTKNPEGPRIIAYMASIAPHFDAIVVGDVGEVLATESDWGTQSDWDASTAKAPKPLRKRNLSRRNRIIAGLLLGLLLFVLMRLWASK